MKLFLPASFVVLAASACCCCGSDMQELFEQQGINIPDNIAPEVPSSGARATQMVPKGSVVKVVDVHSEDPYFSDKVNFIGKTCTLVGDSRVVDGEWHRGLVTCGTDFYYFFKAAYEVISAVAAEVEAAPAGPPKPLTLEEMMRKAKEQGAAAVPAGATVPIVDVHSEELPVAATDSSGGLGGRGGGLGGGGLGAIGGDPIIDGALDKSLIDAVIKRNINQIRYCYQRELTKNPTLGGKITVKFVISKDGSVSTATTKASTMGSPAVEGCINGRFMRFQFPEPKDGGIVNVSYPFIFSPG